MFKFVRMMSRRLRGLPGELRDHSLALTGAASTPGETTVIKATCKVDFWPRRLVVHNKVAMSFVISDIKIDGVSQLQSTAPMPALIFSESASEAEIVFKKLPAGKLLEIAVTNISTEPAEFTGAMIGGIPADKSSLLMS